MSIKRICATLIFLMGFAPGSQLCMGAPGNDSENVMVSVPVEEMQLGYLNWMEHHPEVMKNAPEPMILQTPYLKFLSPEGKILYEGSDDEQNAAFLHRLQHQVPVHSVTPPGKVGPTLQEYIEMLKELRPFKAQLLAGDSFIIFAVTNGDLKKSRLQDEAVRTFSQHSNIKLVEVKLIF